MDYEGDIYLQLIEKMKKLDLKKYSTLQAEAPEEDARWFIMEEKMLSPD